MDVSPILKMMEACSSRKRKRSPEQSDEEERGTVDHESRLLSRFHNNDSDQDDDDDAQEDETVLIQRRKEYEEILQAQEAPTVKHYDNIEVTPFNLDDEREEGEFDESGNFVFRSENKEDEGYDEWAESVDWEAVKRKQASQPQEQAKPSVSDNTPEPVVVDRLTCYKQMLRIMRPDETVQRAIKRLGDTIPKRRVPNKAKPSTTQPETISSSEVAEMKAKLEKMIELAHTRLEDGEVDIYQKSYEDLEDAIN